MRRDPDSVIDGLLVVDRAENLAAVDQREERYRRVSLTPSDLELSAETRHAGCSLYVYEASADQASVRLEIIQSYLDAVLQGFLREYGRAGVERFVRETEGFDATVIADRKTPGYPRAVRLEADEEAYFDALIMQKFSYFAPFVR
ncbi:hypothetical protein A33O_02378 [Nitratireductor aquibiodomus RA22]|uniref:Uncharacterized protein n=1 Tax=Nitratireductor aquibiodomus RA22 TaxID=1189611 RepID=I5C648_9HYPH|nr:hypothetical protein A33O_02378 [Nitratireductor aquibiodomus RA22]